ncbi:S8 family serine peptidase [Nocardioides sp. URHA0032]|uniref:S8 family serine peptidase n=1 Tax=Nocardioides sp. URHA0032 TaxID=1380388 RepID=UPI0012DC0C32|nr:S8 family serine peptidase [Nocardioides sp. URHA0032]
MRTRRSLAVAASVAVVCGLTLLNPAEGSAPPDARPTANGFSKSVDRSLGNGLGRLVASSGSGKARVGSSGLRVDQGSLSIRDDQGRVMVNLTPQAGTDRAAYRKQAEKLGLVVTSTNKQVGTLEGFAPLSAMKSLAALDDTGTLVQELRPITHVGSTTSQGVKFQRIDKVLAKGVRGQGMTVGVLSDSYDSANNDVFGDPLTIHADDDIASGDLPGTGNPQNSQPVVVIQDGDSPDTDTDEGRGMLQIVHDVAPDAKLCFATAFSGDQGFADNIRALADPAGPCGADVIVDDVSYFDEPFFSDGLIGDAVDDVAAQGVSYFSSSGNAGDHGAWDGKVNLVSKAKGLKNTNLDFSGVDPALYAGGLQDMDPGAGTDIAQDFALGAAGGLYDLQWNDPVDADGADLGDPYFERTGELTSPDDVEVFHFTPTADQLGKQVLVTTDAIPSGTTDLILDLVKPDGTEVGPIDTGSSPEKLSTTLDQAGEYTIKISGFSGDEGDFTVKVQPILAPSNVTTDFNVLAFAPDGTYYGVLGDDNTLTGQPAEVLPISGVPDLQLVIADATPGPAQVSHLRLILNGDIYVSEYFDPSAPATFGHPTAAGAIGVGAYDPFKAFLPEPYTSPGGKLKMYFDSQGNRYDTPKTRMKPEISATDRGNTTFFVADDLRDSDDFPNFGGTSASAPHAAAIAALMIQKAGGPGSMAPAQVRTRLEHSTFGHDLDPFRSSGSAHGLKIMAVGSSSDERNATPGSLADRNFFRVSYSGKQPIASIQFLGETASPTSLKGIVFDPRHLGQPELFRDGGFPFTVGQAHGIQRGSIKASFSGRFKGLTKGVFQNMTVKFGKQLRKGQSFGFGVDRDAALWAPDLPAIEGNNADELGGAFSIPSGKKETRGMVFKVTLVNGKTFTGRFVNKLGQGWSAVDGYGVVNAQEAVLGH